MNQQRPFAVGDDPRRFWALTYTLAITDWKLRFFGSALGYLWSLIRPLLFFGVLYLVFAQILHIGGGVRFYPAYLLTAIVLWSYFAEATTQQLTSLVNRESLLRKMRFPRMVIPLSVALTSLLNLAGNFLAVLVFVLAVGARPHWTWVEMPLLLLLLGMLSVGVGMLLAALYVRFRDVAPIWEVVQQALFYATPILYVAANVPGAVRELVLCNPVAAILTQMRHAFIDPAAPTAAQAMGSGALLLIPLGIVVGLFALGLWVFNRETPRIAENL